MADQLIEISLRVDSVRPFAVESMLSMLLTDSLILGQVRLCLARLEELYDACPGTPTPPALARHATGAPMFGPPGRAV